MAEPDPARLAAIDQQLADLDARLNRNARAVLRGDAALLPIALAAVIYILSARPQVSYWFLAAAWAVAALGAAGGIIQGLMLRPRSANCGHRPTIGNMFRLVRETSATGGLVVCEEEAVKLAADVVMLRAARGHDVALTAENSPRLVRAAALMIDALERTEDGDG